MLGISVYMSQYDSSYIEQARVAGAEYVFTSMQMPEEDYDKLRPVIKEFFTKCHELKLKVVSDVSPVTFEKLGLANNDFQALQDFGFSAVRLDYGIDDLNLIKQLQKQFTVFLNASIVSPEYLEKLLQSGVDRKKLILSYNYYPHVNTGLSWASFIKRNRAFVKMGVRTQAFVPGDWEYRFPMYEGLPTVERHRGMNSFVAAVELMHEAGVTDVFISDTRARISGLERIVRYQREGIISLKTDFLPEFSEYQNLTLAVRKDQPERIVRLLAPRKKIEPRHQVKISRGAVILQNELAKRYSGEVYLAKVDLPSDPGSNIIGYIMPEYMPLLEQIDEKNKIILNRKLQ